MDLEINHKQEGSVRHCDDTIFMGLYIDDLEEYMAPPFPLFAVTNVSMQVVDAHD